MFRRISLLVSVVGCITTMAVAQQVCPGFNKNNNTNLACELATVTRTTSAPVSVLDPTTGKVTQSLGGSSLASLSPTLATQLSELPIATAVSGSGLTFSKSLGIVTANTDSLGSILTQRGETIGRHKFYVAVNYQRFKFDSIDGVSMKDMPTWSVQGFTGFSTVAQQDTRIDLRVDQFTGLATFGLTSRIDAVFIVPYSKVTLATAGLYRNEYSVLGTCADTCTGTISPAPVAPLLTFPGSAHGIGDVIAAVKGTVKKGERTAIAIGSEVRFPTGDANNYLGSGAYGIKPYVVVSHRGKRFTPNTNIGYQWNGSSSLALTSSAGSQLNLPSSLLYSGGVDMRVNKRFTIAGELLGQYVINGPRISLVNTPINPGTGCTGGLSCTKAVKLLTSSYAMDNGGIGFKYNPFKGLLITGNALFKLDDAGLRSKVVPLVGISYRF